MNAIKISGRTVYDATLRKTDSGREYALFTVAVERARKGCDGKPVVDFINCKVWGGPAKYVCGYCRKGTMVAVEGELHIDGYVDRDCIARIWTEISVSRVSRLQKKAAAAQKAKQEVAV